MMMIIVVVIVMMPLVAMLAIVTVPIPAALVVTTNPMMMIAPMSGHPNVMPAVIPELWPFIVRSIAYADLKIDRLRGRAEKCPAETDHRAHQKFEGSILFHITKFRT